MGHKYSDKLWTNENLLVGESLSAPNGSVTLTLQPDGNLVLYKNPEHHALWASGTNGKPVAKLSMVWDGHLRLYDHAGKVVWESGTGGHKDAFLQIQNDGNMVVYKDHNASSHTAIWASGTYHYAQGSVTGAMGSVYHSATPASFITNAAKTAGREIGSAMHAVQDFEGKIGKEIGKIPVVGAPLHAIFDASFAGAIGPTRMIVAVAIDGQSLDKAFMREVNEQIHEFKEIGPYAQMIVSFIPGIGTAISAAIGVGLAIANGQPIDQVLISGVAGALPGGPLAKAALELADQGIRAAVEHTKFDLQMMASTAAGVASDALNLPAAAKDAILAGVNMAGQLVHGVKIETALAMSAVAALPVSQDIKRALSTASSIALDLAHGARVDKVLLSHVQDAASFLPIDDKLKRQITDMTRTGKALVQGHPEQALQAALQTATADGLVHIGGVSLPKQVQEALHVGVTMGSAVVHQARRAEQLTKVIPGKLIQSGIQLAKTNPVFAEARKLAGQGTKGFDLGSGLASQVSRVFDIAHVRSTLQGADLKGFDMALAVRVGAVAQPPARQLSAPAQAGHAMTLGMQGAPASNKQAIMASVAAHPSASVGAVVAVKAVAVARESWLHHLLRMLHLVHA